MANSGFLGLGLLAYASWQTITFLNDRTARVWAKQRYHRYLPRSTAENLKKGKSCGSCSHYEDHAEFLHSGICSHHEWRSAMRSMEVMVKREGSCELFQRTSPRLPAGKGLSPDPSLPYESASEFPLH